MGARGVAAEGRGKVPKRAGQEVATADHRWGKPRRPEGSAYKRALGGALWLGARHRE